MFCWRLYTVDLSLCLCYISVVSQNSHNCLLMRVCVCLTLYIIFNIILQKQRLSRCTLFAYTSLNMSIMYKISLQQHQLKVCVLGGCVGVYVCEYEYFV